MPAKPHPLLPDPCWHEPYNQPLSLVNIVTCPDKALALGGHDRGAAGPPSRSSAHSTRGWGSGTPSSSAGWPNARLWVKTKNRASARFREELLGATLGGAARHSAR